MNPIPKKFIFSLVFLSTILGVGFRAFDVSASTFLQQTTSTTNSGAVGTGGDKSQGLGTNLTGSIRTLRVRASADSIGQFRAWIYESPTANRADATGTIATFDDNPTTGNQGITISTTASATYNLYTVGTASFDPSKYYFISFDRNDGGTISHWGTTSNNYTNGACTRLSGGFHVSCQNSVLDLYFILNDPLTTTDYVEIISPPDGSISGYFQTFEVKYKYSNEFYNLYNNREIKIYLSNDAGVSYLYTSNKTFTSTLQEQTIIVPVPEDLGFDDYIVYAELWINNSKIFTSDSINFSTYSILPGEGNNPFEAFSPPSSSYVLGKLTTESASNSKQTCGNIYEDSDSFLGAGFAYGFCLAGSFLFEPSEYSKNLVKGQLYRVPTSFPFDWVTAVFEVGTTLLTDDFIASSSNSSLSWSFEIGFDGLGTSPESTRHFATGSFSLLSSQSLTPYPKLIGIIQDARLLLVSLMWISFVSGVVYFASRQFNKTET